MTALTRRNLLGSAALAAAATRCRRQRRPPRPPPASRRAAFYRYKVGSYELTAIHDGVWMREDRQQLRAQRRMAGVAEGDGGRPHGAGHRCRPRSRQLLVNTGSKLVLIDTGTGGQLAPAAGSFGGQSRRRRHRSEAASTRS